MSIMCLDLASTFGFAIGDAAGVQAHGSFALPSTGANYGLFLKHYRRWLEAAIEKYQPKEICYESPILSPTTSIHTLRKLYSMGPRTEEIAQEHGLITSEANLTHIRVHFVGHARAPKTVVCKAGCRAKQCGRCRAERRKWIKDTTITTCRRAGLRPEDDNDADALALFSFVMSTRVPNFELLGTEIARAA